MSKLFCLFAFCLFVTSECITEPSDLKWNLLQKLICHHCRPKRATISPLIFSVLFKESLIESKCAFLYLDKEITQILMRWFEVVLVRLDWCCAKSLEFLVLAVSRSAFYRKRFLNFFKIIFSKKTEIFCKTNDTPYSWALLVHHQNCPPLFL